MALNKQDFWVPLARGLNQKTDARALSPMELSDLQNAEFTKAKGIQKRFGSTALTMTDTSGNAITNFRRLATRDNELLLFTKEALYTYIDNDDRWASRGSYYAVKNTERDISIRTTEQYNGNRCTAANVTLYVWVDKVGATGTVRATAVDATTGGIIVADQSLGTGERPKIFYLSSADKFLIIWINGSNVLQYLAVDPDSVATDIAGSVTSGTTAANGYYDACLRTGTDTVWVVGNDPGGGAGGVGTAGDYWIRSATSNSGGVITLGVATAKARDSDAAIAISYGATPDYLGVVRNDSVTADILADVLTGAGGGDVATYVDIAVDNSVSSTANQITCVWKDTTDSSAYRCYAFWSSDAAADSDDAVNTEYGWFSSSGTTSGPASTILAYTVRPASKAFLHNGVPCLNLVFDRYAVASATQIAAQPQSSYFLWHLTGGFIGLSCLRVAGGHQKTTSFLPEVQNTSSNVYSWLGLTRSVFISSRTGSKDENNNPNAYRDRNLRDITYTFDSDDARRAVQVGKTLYIAGSMPMQYDGASLVEIGWLIFPWVLSLAVDGTGTTPAEGTYFYRPFLEANNKQGERTISSSVWIESVTHGAGVNGRIVADIPYQPITRRSLTTGGSGIVLYRSKEGPNQDSPRWRVTSHDPSTTGANSYLPNSSASSSWSVTYDGDDLSDSNLVTKEIEYLSRRPIPLDNLSPASCTIIAHCQRRIFLGGLTNPNAFAYSQYREDGCTVEFNDALAGETPGIGGDVTGFASLNESVIVFKERAIFLLPGTGPDNNAQGAYGEPQLISRQIGCTKQDLLCETPMGVIFMSRRGIWLLDTSYQLQPIGFAVEDEATTNTYVKVIACPDQPQVRFLSSTTDKTLVYDYDAQQWSVWTIDGLDAVVHRNVYKLLDSTAVRPDSYTTWKENGTAYSLIVQTGWIRPDEAWSWNRIYQFFIIGEYRASHTLRIRIAYDGVESWIDDETWAATPTTVGGVLECRVYPSRQKCSAMKIRIEDTNNSGTRDESLALTGILFRVGLKGGVPRRGSTQDT